MKMKQTAFYEIHKQLGAKMVSFAGYEMPIQYPKGIISEHRVVRQNVGVFDVTHMGEFEVKGPDALAFVQKTTINDASNLDFGKAQYSAMCFENGGIVDDLLVYRLEDGFMLVVNASNIDKNFEWLSENTAGYDVQLTNISDEINLLAIQGPQSLDTLNPLADVDMSQIEFYNFALGKIAGVDAIISRTGYTGELGFEIYFRGDVARAEHVWNEIFMSGDQYGIEPVGLGARDTLRLEKGYCLYGNDIDQSTNPIEAGLGWITKVDKGEFNGRDIIVKVKEEKPDRRLVAFRVNSGRFIPRKDYRILIEGKEAGVVTSGNLSPMLDQPIGMGYVVWEHKAPGTILELEARGRTATAEIIKLPFV